MFGNFLCEGKFTFFFFSNFMESRAGGSGSGRVDGSGGRKVGGGGGGNGCSSGGSSGGSGGDYKWL